MTYKTVLTYASSICYFDNISTQVRNNTRLIESILLRESKLANLEYRSPLSKTQTRQNQLCIEDQKHLRSKDSKFMTYYKTNQLKVESMIYKAKTRAERQKEKLSNLDTNNTTDTVTNKFSNSSSKSNGIEINFTYPAVKSISNKITNYSCPNPSRYIISNSSCLEKNNLNSSILYFLKNKFIKIQNLSDMQKIDKDKSLKKNTIVKKDLKLYHLITNPSNICYSSMPLTSSQNLYSSKLLANNKTKKKTKNNKLKKIKNHSLLFCKKIENSNTGSNKKTLNRQIDRVTLKKELFEELFNLNNVPLEFLSQFDISFTKLSKIRKFIMKYNKAQKKNTKDSTEIVENNFTACYQSIWNSHLLKKNIDDDMIPSSMLRTKDATEKAALQIAYGGNISKKSCIKKAAEDSIDNYANLDIQKVPLIRKALEKHKYVYIDENCANPKHYWNSLDGLKNFLNKTVLESVYMLSDKDSLIDDPKEYLYASHLSEFDLIHKYGHKKITISIEAGHKNAINAHYDYFVVYALDGKNRTILTAFRYKITDSDLPPNFAAACLEYFARHSNTPHKFSYYKQLYLFMHLDKIFYYSYLNCTCSIQKIFIFLAYIQMILIMIHIYYMLLLPIFLECVFNLAGFAPASEVT